jgi:PAS domain S-box-containing protein
MSSQPGISGSRASYSALAYLLSFGIALAVPLVLLLGALLYRSALAERDRLEQRVLQVLDDLAGDIDRDLDRHLTLLGTLATSESLKNEDWPAFYKQAQASLQGRAYLILIDATGRQLVNTYVPYGEQPTMTGDPETLRRMAESKAPVVSNLFTSLVVKKPVFNVSIPVLSDGRLRYVMSLGLLPDDLVSLLAGQKLAPDWVSVVWDANGTILARSRDHARHVGRPEPEHMREKDREAVVRTTNLDGQDVLHATRRSAVSSWGIGVNIPYRVISEDLRSSLLLWGAAGVVAIAIALGLSWFIARQITASLSIASEAAIAFGHGQPFRITGSRLKEAEAFLTTLDRAHRELEERSSAVQRAEEQFRLAVEAAPNGMILATTDGRIVSVNRHAERLLGYGREELIGEKVETLVPDQFRAEHPVHRTRYALDPVTRSMGSGRDVFARCKDGSTIPVEIGLSAVTTSQGVMILAAMVDISDRKKAEQSQRLVIGELKHRTRNLLAIVQTIAGRSIDEARTLDEAKLVLTGRIRALASAYAMLADARWERVELRKIIERQIADLSPRISISGCDIFIVPSAAQQFAMIVHELGTNALKYGSLSMPQGSVSIEGRTGEDGSFHFSWREVGGPILVSAPVRKGFGSVILLDAAQHFAESVNAEHLPSGLIYSLRLRLSTIEAGPAPDAGRERQRAADRQGLTATQR